MQEENKAEKGRKSVRETCRIRLKERFRASKAAILENLERHRLERIRKKTVPQYEYCKNCGEKLAGMYCHRCGQYALDVEQPFWKYLKQYFENVYQFDNKVWRTLWLLFRRPGFLTREFTAGKVGSYVHPFRLYMFLSVLFFLFFFTITPDFSTLVSDSDFHLEIGELLPEEEFSALLEKKLSGETLSLDTIWLDESLRLYSGLTDVLQEKDSLRLVSLPIELMPYLDRYPGDSVYHCVSGLFEAKQRLNRMYAEHFYNGLLDWAAAWLPVVMMVFLPLFAWLCKVAFKRQKMPFMSHFVFSLHVHSIWMILTFFYLLCLLRNILRIGLDDAGFATPWVQTISWVFMLLNLFFLVFSARSVYTCYGWGKVIFKSMLLFLLYFGLSTLILSGIFVWRIVTGAMELELL